MLPKTNAVALPGYTLSQFRLADYQQAEDYFVQRYLSGVGKGAVMAPPSVREQMFSAAAKVVADGKFAFGMPGFDVAAQTGTNLPYMLWICLSAKHALKPSEAASLLTDENEEHVARAVMEMMRYKLPNVGEAGTQTPPPGHGTGQTSSKPSLVVESDTAKPAE